MELFSEDLLEGAHGLFAIEEQIYDMEVNMPFFHHHNHYEMIYMTDGVRSLYIGDKKYELNPGNAALLPPYLAHKTTGSGFPTRRRILINFKKEFVCDMLPDTSLLSIFNTQTHIFEFDAETRSLIRKYFEDILSIYLYDDFYKDYALKLKLCELILLINKKGFSEEIAKSDDIAKKFTSIARFINNNCHSKITLDSISSAFDIDKYQLSRQFKNYLGVSFVTYINNVRITRARRMMLNGLNNITEIALNNGFDSPTHFSRVFKTMTGQTPKQYVKEHRNASSQQS